MYIYDNTSLNSSENKKYFRQNCRENFFSSENLAVYEVMWENFVEPRRPQMTVWRMRIACWVTKVRILKNFHNIKYLTIVERNTKYSVARQQCKGKAIVAFLW